METRGVTNGKKNKDGIHMSLVIVTVCILYSRITDLKLFADDFTMWHAVGKADSWADILFLTYNPEFYRPLEMVLIKINQIFLGTNSILYHLVAIAGHMSVTILVYLLAKRLRFSEGTAILASLFFGFSNANAMAVCGNDSAGQVYSALFGLWAVFLLLKDEPSIIDSSLAAALLFVSLLWKDTATSYALCLFVLLGLKTIPKRDYKRFVILLLPLILTVTIYMVLRSMAGAAGPDIGNDGRYQMWFGTNIPKNIALLFGAMATPIGATFLVIKSPETWQLFLTNRIFLLLIVFIVFSGLIYGAWIFLRNKKQSRRRLYLPLLLFGCLFLPDCLVNRVSELYTYKPNALFCILFAGCIVTVYSLAKKRSKTCGLVVAMAVVLLLVLNVISVKHKEGLMRLNGENAYRMINQIKSQVNHVPKGTPVYYLDLGIAADPWYSVFHMHGMALLGAGEFIEDLYGYKPPEYKHLQPKQIKEMMENPAGTCLIITNRFGNLKAKLVSP